MLAKITMICYIMSCCSQNVKMQSGQDTSLYQYWIHSTEEDDASQKITVYRPATYQLPPARGREGFEIKEKGVFIAHPIAPGDGNLTVQEKWTLKDGNLTITGKDFIYVYKIVSLTKDKLVLKSLSIKRQDP